MTLFRLFRQIIHSQFIATIPPVQEDLSGKIYIVTGANVGLGLECARLLTKLNAEKVILGVRTSSKGQAAKESIIQSTGRADNCVEVWPVDLLSTTSVKAFAARVNELQRVDGFIDNAAILTDDFELAEGEESTIKINVISTMLLALLVLPKLRESAANFKTTPHLPIVVSESHFVAKFRERNQAEDIFKALRTKESSSMADRYNVSKLIVILFCREMEKHLTPSPVIINMPNPGNCNTELLHRLKGPKKVAVDIYYKILAHSAEKGGRKLVHAVLAGGETDGLYLNDAAVIGKPSDLVVSEEGAELGKKLYNQLLALLESLQPGISKNI